MVVTDWTKYALFFKEDEFKCSHTGKCEMQEEFMDRLYNLRGYLNYPFIISSGFRDVSHPVEAKKDVRGEHTFGIAADIVVYGKKAFQMVSIAEKFGFTRIGISQRGDISKRFIHLGTGEGVGRLPNPWIWSY